MEVIKKGTKNLVDCLDCGSRLKFDVSDLTKEYEPPRGPYEMEGYDAYYCHCPCGTKLNITSKISSGMARRYDKVEKARRLSDYDL